MEARRDCPPVGGGILVCISFLTLLEAILRHFAGKENFEEGSLPYLVFSSLTLHGSILAGTAVFLWWHRVSWREAFGFSTPFAGRAILLGVIVALVFVPVGSALRKCQLRLIEAVSQCRASAAGGNRGIRCKAGSLASRIYLAAFAVIMAPGWRRRCFFAAFFMSGVKQLGYPRLAWWGSAAVFAAIHFSAAIFLPLLLLGLMLAWLYEKTNNLLASITAHSLFNAINVALLFFGEHQDAVQTQTAHHLK